MTELTAPRRKTVADNTFGRPLHPMMKSFGSMGEYDVPMAFDLDELHSFLQYAGEVMQKSDVALQSVQEAMEFLIVQAMLSLQHVPESVTNTDQALLESFKIQRRRPEQYQGNDCTEGIWASHITPKLNTPVPLRMESQDIGMFGDEPPRLAHTCGILFSTKAKMRSPPGSRHERMVIDLRYVFQSPRRAEAFFLDAMDYLSEWLATDEMSLPGYEQIAPNARFFRRCPMKSHAYLQQTAPETIRSATGCDAVYCIWLERNVVCKTCIVSYTRGVNLTCDEISRWFIVATNQVRSWVRSFPSNFSPASMNCNVLAFYERVVQARIELPDWTINEFNLSRDGCEGARQMTRLCYASDRRRPIGSAHHTDEPVITEIPREGNGQTSPASNAPSPSGSNEGASQDNAQVRTCKMCKVARTKNYYSKRVWKNCKDDSQYQPVCTQCRSDQPAASSDAADQPAASTDAGKAALEEEERERIRKLSVKELKAFLDAHSVSYAHLLEKSELVAAALDAATAPAATRTAASSSGASSSCDPYHQEPQAMAKQEEEEEDTECGICFFAWSKKHKKVLRPCCRQPICFKCDTRCMKLKRGCPFCRGGV